MTPMRDGNACKKDPGERGSLRRGYRESRVLSVAISIISLWCVGALDAGLM